MRLTVDVKRCLGAGMCVLRAPEVFDQDERDGTVILRAVRPSPEQRERVLDAVAGCPNEVIRVVT